MKYFIKLFCLVLSVLVIGATLCGCQELDDMRARTAVFDDDTKESFTFRDTTYKRINTPKNVAFILDDTEWGYHITEKDVPVMLAEAFGNPLIFKDTGVAPVVTAAINVFSDSDGLTIDNAASYFRNAFYSVSYAEDRLFYYVREDKFEDIKKLLDNPIIDRYYLNTWEYEDEDQEWLGGQHISKLLDKDCTDAVNRTLKDGEKTKWNTLEQKSPEWKSFQLFPCDKDIVITNGKIYNVVTDTFDYYIYEDNNDSVLYKASDEDFEAFRKMYKLNNESIGMEDIEWHIRNSESGWN